MTGKKCADPVNILEIS